MLDFTRINIMGRVSNEEWAASSAVCEQEAPSRAVDLQIISHSPCPGRVTSASSSVKPDRAPKPSISISTRSSLRRVLTRFVSSSDPASSPISSRLLRLSLHLTLTTPTSSILALLLISPGDVCQNFSCDKAQLSTSKPTHLSLFMETRTHSLFSIQQLRNHFGTPSNKSPSLTSM